MTRLIRLEGIVEFVFYRLTLGAAVGLKDMIGSRAVADSVPSFIPFIPDDDIHYPGSSSHRLKDAYLQLAAVDVIAHSYAVYIAYLVEIRLADFLQHNGGGVAQSKPLVSEVRRLQLTGLSFLLFLL